MLSECDKIRLEVYGPELFARIKMEEDAEDHKLSREIRVALGKSEGIRRRGNPIVALDSHGKVMDEFDGIRGCAERYGIAYSPLAAFMNNHRPYASFRTEAGAWLQYRHDYEQGYGMAVPGRRRRAHGSKGQVADQ